MFESLTNYEVIGISVALVMLILGSIIDIWKREIHDYYWIGFGGTDAFALIALAVIAPMATLTDNPISPFTTLSNAAILFVIPFLINIIRNGMAKIKGEDIFEGFEESNPKKIIAMLIGYKAKNPKFAFSIEKIENGKKKISLTMHHAENQEFCDTPNTWITPGIPYLLLITGGFVIQLLFGDVILGWLLGI